MNIAQGENRLINGVSANVGTSHNITSSTPQSEVEISGLKTTCCVLWVAVRRSSASMKLFFPAKADLITSVGESTESPQGTRT